MQSGVQSTMGRSKELSNSYHGKTRMSAAKASLVTRADEKPRFMHKENETHPRSG